MVKATLFFIGFVIFGFSNAHAQSVNTHLVDIDRRISQVSQSARTNLLAAERVVYAANQAIDAAAVIVSSVKNDRIIHNELKRLAAGVPGARAIIVIDEKGTLIHDSYKYPVAPLDLSDRSYFREAMIGSGLRIATQVVGRTSGAAFVPLVKRFGSLTYVVVATPYSLLDIQSECGDCWSMLLNKGGNVVTIYPPEASVAANLINVVSNASSNSGSRVVRYRNSIVALAWRQSLQFPFIVISVRGLPDTATVDVDLN